MRKSTLHRIAIVVVAVALGSAVIATDAVAAGGNAAGHWGGGGGGGQFGGAMGGSHFGGGIDRAFGGGHFGGAMGGGRFGGGGVGGRFERRPYGWGRGAGRPLREYGEWYNRQYYSSAV